MIIKEFIEKHFPPSDAEEKKKISECLEKGTNWECMEPGCGYKWVSKSGEVFEKCPKCGSNKIMFRCDLENNELWNALWHDESWD